MDVEQNNGEELDKIESFESHTLGMKLMAIILEAKSPSL